MTVSRSRSTTAKTMIVVEDLWKCYRLGEFGSRTLSEDLRLGWSRLRGRPDPLAAIGDPTLRYSDDGRQLWVLRGVDLEVNQGDVVGLIGPNGAGKSTILKILSRVTTPSRGHVHLGGRVSSLLEVGTGFHPELTGRENIYLNGTIMGLTRKQVAARLDEIVEFSECGAHIDTPVRRFSSGMFVRLGFAVAAHLNTEILVVDEVLAVGDVRFQAKCIDKMTQLAAEGVTVVFVSHNASLVQRLCTRAAVIDDGRAVMFESVDDALGHYHRGRKALSSEVRFDSGDPTAPQITGMSIDSEALDHGRIVVDLQFESPRPFVPVPGLIVYAGDTQPAFTSNTRIHPGADRAGRPPQPCRSGTFRFELENLDLYSGTYTVSAWLGDEGSNFDVREHVFEFVLSTKHELPGDLSVRYVGPMAVSPRWTLL